MWGARGGRGRVVWRASRWFGGACGGIIDCGLCAASPTCVSGGLNTRSNALILLIVDRARNIQLLEPPFDRRTRSTQPADSKRGDLGGMCEKPYDGPLESLQVAYGGGVRVGKRSAHMHRPHATIRAILVGTHTLISKTDRGWLTSPAPTVVSCPPVSPTVTRIRVLEHRTTVDYLYACFDHSGLSS